MKITKCITAVLLFLSLGTFLHAQCISGDCINGSGIYSFKNNSATYQGDFKNGQPQGFGLCEYANGDQYEGFWETGKFSGQGRLTQASGKFLNGIWNNGQFSIPNAAIAKVISTSNKIVQSAAPRKTWALVVGVASYEHMPVLRYADDDAWLFYSNLISNSGLDIDEEQAKILIDESATRKNILAELNNIKEQAGPNDLVLFYFSGHGHEGSFLPIDYDGFNNQLFHSEVNSILAKTKAEQKICIADACHSGSLFAAKGANENSFKQLYADFYKENAGTALILSSKSKETSLESKGLRQGVFTYFLVKGIKGEADINADKKLVLQELFNYIYKEVRDYTGKLQTPILEGEFDPNIVLNHL